MTDPAPPARAARRAVRCPRCGHPAEYSAANAFRPFCSERCRTLDLGAWASEAYRVAAAPPGAPADDDGDDDPGDAAARRDRAAGA